MRIISKFRDYYDTATMYGQDMNRVFVRETSNLLIPETGLCHVTIKDMDFALGVVGFCGKIYPFIKPVYPSPKYKVVSCIYRYEDLAYLLEHGKNTDSRRWRMDTYDITVTKQWLSHDWKTVGDVYRWRSTTGLDKLEDIFMSSKTPYFAGILSWYRRSSEDVHLKLLPNLKEYRFQSIMDAYTTYQEIDMYLNNTLCTRDNPHIDKIPDELKAESHGFNRFSFRKDKSK